LIIFAVIPCLAILLYSGVERKRHLIEDAKSDVSLLTRTIAESQKKITLSTMQTLSILSRLPSIQDMDSVKSTTILKSILKYNPNYSNMALIDLKGDVIASGKTFTKTNLADRKHIMEAIDRKDFAVGEYIQTRIGTSTPAFPFAFPVFDKDARLTAILTAAIKLDVFSHFYDASTLPEKSFIAITDYKGIRMFYYPIQKNTNPIGKPIKDYSWNSASKGGDYGIFSGTGSDGLRRIFSYEKIRIGQGETPYLYVWVGIPEDYILGPARAALIRNLLFMLLTTVLSLIIAWVVAKRTVIAPVQSLVALTHRLSRGDLDVRSELTANPGELGTLTKAFYNMADALNANQRTLRESEKKYRYLFNNAPAGIYEIDFVKNKFINVNDIICKYSGYSEKEFLAMNPLDFLTEDSQKLYVGRLEKFFAGENLSDSFEYNIIKKNGQKLCVILNNDYIYENGKLTGSRVVAHDITELKKAQKDKIDAQKIASEQKKLALVGQVAGKMAHDFNNVLGIIMGNTELSLIDCKDEETKKILELIFEQTIRGKNLTKNLVAFAKDQEPKQEFFRISDKIDLVLNLLKKDLKGIELIREDKPEVPDLLADAGMIEHALINLIQNSIHATSMSGYPKIIFRTYSLDENICFEIEDNGCGITKDNLKNIYKPSFTLKGTKDIAGSYGKGIKGTGYGMANVKKYIEQHKGSISVESEFSSGTKFTVSLPVIKKELTSKEKAELQKENIYFDKQILLVEDETAISGVQYRILSQEPCNHKVDIANDGQVAMDLFKRNEYDLISLDYVLPGGINGMDVYNHIRKTNKTIPILFISGNIEFLESIKDLKQKDGNIDHLSKPCQNKDYINSINKLLERTLSAQLS